MPSFFCYRVILCLLSTIALSGCVEPTSNAAGKEAGNKEANNKEASTKANVVNSIESISILAGTYTSENGSQGIYQFDYNPETLTFGALRLAIEANNPSFGLYDAESQRFYAVAENNPGGISSYAWDKKAGSLDLLGTLPSEGSHPCHLSLSPSKELLALANYSSGNIAVFQVDQVSAVLKPEPKIFQHSGRGPHKERQSGPHAHWVHWSPDGRFLYAVDLGIDQVLVYKTETETSMPDAGKTAITLPPGSGPRHMAFHPTQPLSYIFNELNNRVVVASMQPNGKLKAVQTVDTLPEDFTGKSQGAHIAVSADGQYLYTTNRGHDSIAVFKVAGDGTLEVIQHISTEGHWPRFFMIVDDGRSLLVANQESNNIAAFKVLDNGRLVYSGNQIEVLNPVYMASVQ